MVVAMTAVFSLKSFSQTSFKISNESGYQLFGLMVSQDGGEDWTGDLLTTSEFPSGTFTNVTIPEGYTCQIYIKVTYMVEGEIYEEVLARADVCSYTGIKILANTSGSGSNWMTTQYLGYK